jgi:Fe(3+) dicitrate transport protein
MDNRVRDERRDGEGRLSIGSRHTLGLKLSWYENDANISYRGLLFDEFRAGARYNPAPDDWYLTDRAAVDLNHRFGSAIVRR